MCNISLEADPDPATVAAVRRAWAPEGTKVILYTGTLEPYQGVPLLLESMVAVSRSHPEAVLVVAGGRPDQMETLQPLADELGVADQVRMVGQVPATLIPACLGAADILVSPRERGSNTPLKIFSYLRSGRPIVATDIVSHTQILDGQSCVLVPPTATGLAGGIEGLLEDGPLRTSAVEGGRGAPVPLRDRAVRGRRGRRLRPRGRGHGRCPGRGAGGRPHPRGHRRRRWATPPASGRGTSSPTRPWACRRDGGNGGVAPA